MILRIISKKNYMKLVTSYALANQVCLLFDRSLNTYLCEIYDHKAAFLLVKTVIRNSVISIYGKGVQIL